MIFIDFRLKLCFEFDNKRFKEVLDNGSFRETDFQRRKKGNI